MCRIGEKTVLTRGLDPVPESANFTIRESNSDMSEFDKILTFSGVSEFGSKWHQIREGSGTTFSAKFLLVATPFLIRELSPISDLLAKQDLTTSTSKSEDRHHGFRTAPLSGVVSVNPCPVRHIRLSDTVRDQAVVPCHRRHSVMQFSTSPLLADDDDSQRCK